MTRKILLVVAVLAIVAVGSVAGLVFSGVLTPSNKTSTVERVTLASWTSPNATVQDSGDSSVTLAHYDVSVGQITGSEIYFSPSVTLNVGSAYTFSISSACQSVNCGNGNVTIHITTQTGQLFSFIVLYVVPVPVSETFAVDSYGFNNSTSVTAYLRNTGTVNATLVTYYISDSNGNQWALASWSGPTIRPGTAVATTFKIGSSCSGCAYTGTANAFSSFTSGYSYTFKVVTARNTVYTFSVTKA